MDQDYITTYAFDLNGNRVTKTVDKEGTADDETITSTYNDRDQLVSEDSTNNANDASYEYDGNGSTIEVTTSSGTKKYVWDLRNRMSGYDANGDGDLSDPGDHTFKYDHQGTRVEKSINLDSNSDGVTDGVHTILYVQDKNNPTGYSQVLEEKTSPAPEPTRSYILGHDVIAQADGSTVRHFLYDGGGSTRALLDATGQPVTDQVFAYDAFGNLIEDPANPIVPVTNLLYRGEYFDRLVGQYQLRARYYDPTSGRFSGFDSYEGDVSVPQTLHKYLYAHGNPVFHIDPSGHGVFTLVEQLVVRGIDGLLRAMEIGKVALVRTAVNKFVQKFTAWIVAVGAQLAYRYQQVAYHVTTSAFAQRIQTVGIKLIGNGRWGPNAFYTSQRVSTAAAEVTIKGEKVVRVLLPNAKVLDLTNSSVVGALETAIQQPGAVNRVMAAARGVTAPEVALIRDWAMKNGYEALKVPSAVAGNETVANLVIISQQLADRAKTIVEAL